MTIADAIDRMGIAIDHDNEDLVIARFRPAMAGMEWQKPLSDVADEQVGTNLFFSTGTFYKGRISQSIGRTGENVRRVFEIPLDFDLKDYLQLPSDTVYEMDAETVRVLADALWTDTEPMLTKFGLIPYRVHYTGNGIGVFLRFSDDDAPIDDIRRGVKDLVATLNGFLVSSTGKRVSGGDLDNTPKADKAATDAGTRIMRLPFGISEKSSSNGVLAVRYPAIIATNSDAPSYTLADLQKIAGSSMPKREKPSHETSPIVRVGDEAFRDTVHVMSRIWSQGSRHDLTLGISAWFAKSGVPRDQAERLIRAMAGDDEELESDRMNAVATTYARYAAGESIEGYYNIRTMLPESDLAIIDKELTNLWKRGRVPKSGPSTEFTAPTSPLPQTQTDRERNIATINAAMEAAKVRYPEPPIEAQYGWFGRFMNVADQTVRSNRGFLLTTAMAYTGLITGRRVGTSTPDHRNLYGNMYLMLSGKTYVGNKTTTFDFVMDTLPNAHKKIALMDPLLSASVPGLPTPRITKSLVSGAGLVKILSENEGSPVAYRSSEAKQLFTTMSSERREDPLMPYLNDLWDSPDTLDHKPRENSMSVDAPFFSIIAATQPAALEEGIKSEHIRTGFMNRMMIVYGERHQYGSEEEPDYAALAELWKELTTNILSYADGSILPISDDARRTLSDYMLEVDAAIVRALSDGSANGEREADLFARYPIHARKFALIFAISDGADRIEQRHVDAGIALARWMWEGVRREHGTWGEGKSEKVQTRLKNILANRPVMKRATLIVNARNVGAYTPDDTRKELNALISDGVLYESPDKFICYAHEAQAIIDVFGSLATAAESMDKPKTRAAAVKKLRDAQKG